MRRAILNACMAAGDLVLIRPLGAFKGANVRAMCRCWKGCSLKATPAWESPPTKMKPTAFQVAAREFIKCGDGCRFQSLIRSAARSKVEYIACKRSRSANQRPRHHQLQADRRQARKSFLVTSLGGGPVRGVAQLQSGLMNPIANRSRVAHGPGRQAREAIAVYSFPQPPLGSTGMVASPRTAVRPRCSTRWVEVLHHICRLLAFSSIPDLASNCLV